jgi:hypothetical protein
MQHGLKTDMLANEIDYPAVRATQEASRYVSFDMLHGSGIHRKQDLALRDFLIDLK